MQVSTCITPPYGVTILQDAEHRSSILLPRMRMLPPVWDTPPECGEVVG
jgi:hypothetical protein